MKKLILDNLPTVWVVAIVLLSIVLVSNHASANEKNYDYSPCEGKGWLQKEICKTKIFQTTNWQDGKKQTANTIEKLKSLVNGN